MTGIGERIRAVRLERGESQEAVARRADIATMTLLRVEHGRSQPSLATLAAIAEALEVPLADLLGAA